MDRRGAAMRSSWHLGSFNDAVVYMLSVYGLYLVCEKWYWNTNLYYCLAKAAACRCWDSHKNE